MEPDPLEAIGDAVTEALFTWEQDLTVNVLQTLKSQHDDRAQEILERMGEITDEWAAGDRTRQMWVPADTDWHDVDVEWTRLAGRLQENSERLHWLERWLAKAEEMKTARAAE